MSLQSFLETVSTAIGDDAVARYDDPETYPKIKRIPSGSSKLDEILGGGWPVGRMSMVYGKESSGKSTLALEAIASMQANTEKNAFALFVDTEHAMDFSYAKNLGVDMAKVYFSQPNGANEALKVILESVRHNAHRLIILDSAAALITEDQLQADPGDSSAKAAVARLLAIELPKIISRLQEADCSCIVLNQTRERPGMMFGNPEYTPGGLALGFYASIILKLQKIGQPEEEKGVNVSSKTKANTKKNKTFPPFKECEFFIRYGEGIDELSDLLDLALDLGIFIKKGSWYKSPKGNNLAQGKEAMHLYLKDKQDKLKKLIHSKSK